jgi:hypothetical protein
MAKKFSNTKCIHCCNYFKELTSDHVFPKSWYPNGTPEDVEKWQVPSCKECNNKLGKIENELRIRFGLGLDPNNKAVCGIIKKSLDALNPKKGKSSKDSTNRKIKRKIIIKEILPPEEIPSNSVIPNRLVDFENYKEGVLIDEEHLNFFTKKIIKGITWIASEEYLCDYKYDIEMLIFQHPEDNTFSVEINRCKHEVYSIGDGIKISRIVAAEMPTCGIYEIILWKSIVLHGVVRLRSTQEVA